MQTLKEEENSQKPILIISQAGEDNNQLVPTQYEEPNSLDLNTPDMEKEMCTSHSYFAQVPPNLPAASYATTQVRMFDSKLPQPKLLNKGSSFLPKTPNFHNLMGLSGHISSEQMTTQNQLKFEQQLSLEMT